MKQTRKLIGSLILSVCMVLTMLPVMVFAEAEDFGAPSIGVTGITPAAVNGTINIGGETNKDLTSDQSGTGWAWDASAATLTLSSDYGHQPISIKCRSTDTVNLVYEGNVTITGDAAAASTLKCTGNLKIDGNNGTLAVAYTGGGTNCAVDVVGELDIIGGSLNAASSGSSVLGDSTMYAAVIFGFGGVTISGSANVTATATGADSYGIWADGINISTSGTVNANGTGFRSALAAFDFSEISFSSGGESFLLPWNLRTQNVSIDGGNLKVDGTSFYRAVLILSGVNVVTPVTNISTSTAPCYLSGNATDVNGQLSCLIQSGIQIVTVEAGGETYTGTVNAIDNGATATLTTASAVIGITTEAELKAALESTVPNSNIQLGNNTTINNDAIRLGAAHTLNTNGKTLTITGNKSIITAGKTLTINGGGTVDISNTTEAGIKGAESEATLKLENITVNLNSSGDTSGLYYMNIAVGNGATINISSATASRQIRIDKNQTLSINPGGTININKFTRTGIESSDGTIHINGGTLCIGAHSDGKTDVYISDGLLKYTSGTLTADAGATIFLSWESKVEGMNGRFKDRGTEFTAYEQITVGAEDADASASGLSSGLYIWNNTSGKFERNLTTVTEEPQDVTVMQGTITESLTTAGVAGNGKPIGYQWYRYLDSGTELITGATSSSYSIPANLTEGTYEYFCELTAEGCEPSLTRQVLVTVNAPRITTVITSDDLKAALESSTPATINVEEDITLTDSIVVGAYHTLNTNGKTLTITGNKSISLYGKTLTINGGGVVDISNTDGPGISGSDNGTDTLKLENITVNLNSSGNTSGLYNMNITVGSGATINLNSDTASIQILINRNQTLSINPGGTINIKKFRWGGIAISHGTIHINGGTLYIGANKYGDSGVDIVEGLLLYTSGILITDADAGIYLSEESKVEGMNGRFKDRGTEFTSSEQITVETWDVDVSASSLGSGYYIWNNTSGKFERNLIIITEEPQDVTVTQGMITERLTAESISDNGKPVSYQWYRLFNIEETELIAGATNSGLSIPTNLTAGTYEYYCELGAEGCNRSWTRFVIVTVKPSGSDSGGNGGDSGGGPSSGDNTVPPTAPPTTTPERKPGQPITASAPVMATLGTNGAANAAISDKTITDAIAKAQADAKTLGKTTNGVSVALNVTMPNGTTSLATTLTQNSLNSLVNAGVTSVEISGAPVSLGLDLAALKEIQKQSGGNITISISPATGLSKEAKALIGNRPVYNINISTMKDGKTVSITSIGNGTATLSIPYTPDKNEAVGYLFGVYVDDNGKAARISGSAYDANAEAILLPTGHFSVYGVGYSAPSAKFTDIGTHWGKESIDYVVGRGLLSGTSETTFAPNTAMTRGMLVEALGRLAGVDAKAHTTNSFTDVKAGSAFSPYIEWAYKKGVVQGIGNQQFAPDRAITREEIAVIFANYAKAIGYKLPVTREATTYADAYGIGSGYKMAVTAMQQAGIMTGGTNNKFNPKASATRAEVSSMIYRYIKLTIDPVTAQGWVLNDAGQYLYYKDGKALTGDQTIDGTKYFFNNDGTLKTGWVKDGDNWHLYDGYKMLVGWRNIGSDDAKKTYYFDTYGNMVSGKWLQIDKKWYYFYTDGFLAKDTKIDGYEVGPDGVRETK